MTSPVTGHRLRSGFGGPLAPGEGGGVWWRHVGRRAAIGRRLSPDRAPAAEDAARAAVGSHGCRPPAAPPLPPQKEDVTRRCDSRREAASGLLLQLSSLPGCESKFITRDEVNGPVTACRGNRYLKRAIWPGSAPALTSLRFVLLTSLSGV